ncbi:conjugal transfer protein [Legionella sp. km535]|uniref:conjugal transfer protein n=1 Tax=Legionella sp. km535 TaxID=2498107 RepID=UPI000F8D57C2|nr:conjugal transfer protein [Legionella sp. km535]RUR15291.1 conjugal transfer protein [Legionella sp. km535]
MSLRIRVEKKISRSKRQVFLRSDFEKLSDYDQVGRVLKELSREGKLLKIGYGLYAKARINRITGKPMLAADGGFTAISKEALTRLGIKWQYSDATKSYMTNSTQIPANAEFVVKSRFNRKIGTDKFTLKVVSF